MGRIVLLACALVACGQSRSKVRQVGGQLAVEPGKVDFGDVALGRDAAVRVRLQNLGIVSLNVTQLSELDDAAFDVQGLPVTLEAGGMGEVLVRYRPPALGMNDRAVEMVTDSPQTGVATLGLHGHGVRGLATLSGDTFDFGPVVVNETATQSLVLVNSDGHAETSVEIAAPRGSQAFRIARQGSLTLSSEQSMQVMLQFTPRALGALQATVAVTPCPTCAPRDLVLEGVGVDRLLTVDPSALDFGEALLGQTARKTVTLTNIGTQPLALTAVSPGSPQLTLSLAGRAAPLTLAPGEKLAAIVTYAPAAIGGLQAQATFAASDGAPALLAVTGTGIGPVLQACTLSVSPAGTVEFGSTPVFQPSVQGFELTNTTRDDCIVGDPVLDGGAGGAFTWPGDIVPSGRTLPPGGRMSVRIQFLPPGSAGYQASVSFYVSNRSAPALTVPLHGDADSGCFFLTPGNAGFGGSTLSCPVPDLGIDAVNRCSGAVTVTALGDTGGPFSASAQVPFTVPAQGRLPITVGYHPATAGDDVGSVWVSTSLGTRPRAGLTGGARPPGTIFDQWTQSTAKVDLLLVVDNSASMSEEQHALQQNLERLWARIALANADFHIAVTSTGMNPYDTGFNRCPGGAEGGEGGRFFPVDGSRPRILTPRTPNVKDALFANIDVGTCQWDERFLDPVMAALTPPLIDSPKAPGTPFPSDGNAGFLRDDARLALLAVSDTDDDADVADPPPISDYIRRLAAVKHGARDLISFSGLVPLSSCATVEQVGTRYREIARQLDGKLYDICRLSDFGALLEGALGDLLLPLTSFPLSAHPANPAAIQVTVNGAPVANWTYDAASNRIVFPKDAAPAPGSQIAAKYEPACG